MIFTNILLAYQLEWYYAARFLRFIYAHPKFWILGSQRQSLDWTPKAKLICMMSIFLFVLDIFGILYFALWDSFYYIFLPVAFLLLPLYFIISNFLISPLDIYLKKRIISQAKSKLSEFPELKVIAITGSYGKTTTKEILKTTLWESFEVLATEGTKNTPLGISRLILSQLRATHEIFIVEMGAYSKGNIAELCGLVHPNISIITGITLQHLERFKTLDNIIDAKFEILECLKADDFAIVDTTTQWVETWLKRKNLKVKNIIKISTPLPYTYKENFWGMSFDFHGEKIETKLLANYIGNTLQICYEAWKYLWQSMEDFKKWVAKIDFIEHRMQLIHNPQSNVYILDDSFNGNLEGVKAILDLLEKVPFRGRKILACWGIVELGDKTQEVHKSIAVDIAKVADIVLLVSGPVGDALEAWLNENNYPAEKIKKYSWALKLHEDLKNIIQNWDLVVFQNDLPDHYL